MNEPLFPVVDQRLGQSSRDEITFEFLARGGRAEAVGIRQWMEKWFHIYPKAHRMALKKRLQLKRFEQFLGAYFELQVFSILHLLNCHVEVHPCLSENDGKVDFAATHGQDRFYVEATVNGINQGILRLDANEEDAVHKIRKGILNPHSDICLHATGKLNKTLNKSCLTEPISKLLESYTPNEVRRLQGERAWNRPRRSIKKDDWKLDVYLLPPIASNGRGQIWGIDKGGFLDGSSSMAKALSKKAKDWAKKHLEQDFLIAINACHSEYIPDDARNAIYEHSGSAINHEAFSKSLSRVSGVIVFDNATLGNEHTAPVKMYVNPKKGVSECLQFLTQERCLGELLGRVHT